MSVITFNFLSSELPRVNSYGTSQVFAIRAIDLPENIPYDPNPRRPKLNGAVAKSILETLYNSPESFFVKNSGGINIIAQKVAINKSQKLLTIVLEESHPEINFIGDGILDGGHTYMCIQKVKKEGVLKDSAEVKLEIITNVDNKDIPAISIARNTRKSVSYLSRVHLAGAFEPIKTVLDSKTIQNIQWSENSPGAINSSFCHATHLLKLLFCLNEKEYPAEGTRCPNHVLSSANSNQLEKAIAYSNLINDALDIEKKAYQHIDKFYFSKKGIDGITGLGGGKRVKKIILADGTAFDYSCTVKFIYPILFGFRILLKGSPSEGFQWTIPYEQAWKDLGKDMISILIHALRKAEENRSNYESVLKNSPKIYEEMSFMCQRYLYSVKSKSN